MDNKESREPARHMVAEARVLDSLVARLLDRYGFADTVVAHVKSAIRNEILDENETAMKRLVIQAKREADKLQISLEATIDFLDRIEENF